MPYVKQPVASGDTITSAWGNQVQTQYDEAKTELGNNAGELWTQLKAADGAGSGLDADTLDGLNGSDYATFKGSKLWFRRVGAIATVVNAICSGPDGTVYILSGTGFYAMNPTTGVSSALASVAQVGELVRGADGTTYNVYLAAANHLVVQRYDPAVNTWTTVADVSISAVAQSSFMLTAAAHPANIGEIWVAVQIYNGTSYYRYIVQRTDTAVTVKYNSGAMSVNYSPTAGVMAGTRFYFLWNKQVSYWDTATTQTVPTAGLLPASTVKSPVITDGTMVYAAWGTDSSMLIGQDPSAVLGLAVRGVAANGEAYERAPLNGRWCFSPGGTLTNETKAVYMMESVFD